MELVDLRCFVAVAEELSFTRAGTRLGLAQPHISLKIRQLEAEFGARLFERTKRRVKLTSSGETLLPMARRILGSANAALDTMRLMGAGHAGTISIGATHSSVYTILPQIIQLFCSEYPLVNVLVEGTVDERQLSLLREGRIEVGLLRMSRSVPDIETVELFREEFVVAASARHRFAGEKEISLEEVTRENMIEFAAPFSADFNAQSRSIFAERGLEPNIVRTADSMLLILGLVSAGLGIALVPATLARIKQPDIVFRPLSERLPRLSVRIAWRSDSTSPLIAKFVEVALSVLSGKDANARAITEMMTL